MQRSLTKGPITGSILLFALPLMLAYLLSATPMGVTGIWLQRARRLGAGRCHWHWILFKKRSGDGRGKRRWSTISGSAARGCTT